MKEYYENFKENKIRENIMKVVRINGSPQREGNTSIIIKTAFKELENLGENIAWLLKRINNHTVKSDS